MENQALGGSGAPSDGSLAGAGVVANPIIDEDSLDLEVDGSQISQPSPPHPPANPLPAIAAQPAPPPLPNS